LVAFLFSAFRSAAEDPVPPPKKIHDSGHIHHAIETMREGRHIFRHDTFGDEAFGSVNCAFTRASRRSVRALR